MKLKEKFYVFVNMNGKTVCENRRGYCSKKEAEQKAKMWQDDGFEVGILKL